ncbi:lasso RiPP family leader peptide-containing protein [Frankia umida]|uniref:lasso RiPP family leader peptide-containing protein n=1 Tax=Frankia umida TaxID=573489 RepID=UPI0023ADE95E
MMAQYEAPALRAQGSFQAVTHGFFIAGFGGGGGWGWRRGWGGGGWGGGGWGGNGWGCGGGGWGRGGGW